MGPPRKLVVSGPYQYTRNPMISGVVFILLGEVIIFGSIFLLVWFLFFTIVNYTYFIVGEEPKLQKQFGEDYGEYKRNVPRLFPRRTPWTPGKK
ncbi:methyltransferase family protein [Thalassorhabdus alkalitolerans]|uniref:Methyltransferase family protein n=1 Tax=Thalassorhabdus alkalitolerans TaxID=2282697 RepID=A0ABW0YHP8_9BACI